MDGPYTNAHFSQFSLDFMDFDFEGILKMARLSLISDMGHGLLQDIVTCQLGRHDHYSTGRHYCFLKPRLYVSRPMAYIAVLDKCCRARRQRQEASSTSVPVTTWGTDPNPYTLSTPDIPQPTPPKKRGKKVAEDMSGSGSILSEFRS